jgi:hypothetical protein
VDQGHHTTVQRLRVARRHLHRPVQALDRFPEPRGSVPALRRQQLAQFRARLAFSRQSSTCDESCFSDSSMQEIASFRIGLASPLSCSAFFSRSTCRDARTFQIRASSGLRRAASS